MLWLLHVALPSLIVTADPVPEDNDVVAGGMGALLFVLLILAGAVLMWSLARQLRKAKAAQEAGVYGDQPTTIDRTTTIPPRPEGQEQDG